MSIKGNVFLPITFSASVLFVMTATTLTGCVQTQVSVNTAAETKTTSPQPQSSPAAAKSLAATLPSPTPSTSPAPNAVASATISPPLPPPLEVATSSVLTEAARRNNSLKNELVWTFGGKQQQGWHLYVPLICHLIGTEADADSNEFAVALARWQKSVGLDSDGVLDNDTLARMVSTWQSRRAGSAAFPTADQIVTGAPSEFYDPSRADELRQAERQAYEAYKQMLAAAAADPSLKLAQSGKYLKIISAYRSREYQDKLRQQLPNSGRAGLAVNSPHFTGRAFDIYVGGDPVETKDANRAIQIQTPAYRWLVKNAERFGFLPYFYEPWHWEYNPKQSGGGAPPSARQPK